MAIQKKTEGRDLDEYLQEVWDSLESAWDKSKFDMKQGYDSEYECDCITITSKDNEGVLAKIYVNDYEGKHPVGFDVVYRYPGDKGVGVMGSYEFQSTDMDNLGEEVFDYFDEIKQKVGEAMKNEANTPEEAIKQILLDAAKDREFRREAGEDFSVEDYEKSIDANIEKLRDDFLECFYFDEGEFKCEVQDHEETRNLCSLVAYKVGYDLGLSDGVSDAIDGYLLWYGVQENIVSDESKKSEADATFKVGDFVNYDAESDGDKLSTGWAFAEVVAVNDDGTLKLQPYNLEDYDEVDGVNPQFCEKMEHFAGMTDANTYYMDGKYNVYTGYYEIYVTTKELGKPYGFAGTLDSLDDVEQLMDYYDETMVYDQDIQDEVMSAVYGLTHYDEEDLKGINFADLSDKTESKKSEGLPPKKLGDRKYHSRADLINKMKQVGATEITTRDQYDELRNKQWLHKGGYAMDINGNLVGQTYFGDKDGKWYYATTKTFQGDYLPECKQNEASPDVATIEGLKSLLGRGIAVADNELRCKGVWKLNSKNPKQHQWTFVGDNGSISVKTDDDFKVIRIWGDLNKKSFDLGVSENKEEAKKSEGDEDKVVPDENDFEKCPYCGSHNTDIHYEVDLAKPADVLAYATCKDCGKEYHGQFVFTGAYYGKDEHDYDPIDTCPFCGSKEHTETVQFDGGGYVDQDFKCKSCGGTWYNSFVWSDTQSAFESHTHKAESKKSESLTLKQKELKDMARFGQAEDITTISDEEAKALRKKGIETVGISRGTYGMNGALLRDNEGKKYVITARSSNLFYFV